VIDAKAVKSVVEKFRTSGQVWGEGREEVLFEVRYSRSGWTGAVNCF